jgi:hypothetical protein
MATNRFGRSDGSRTRAAKLLDISIRSLQTLWPSASRVRADLVSPKSTLCVRPLRARVLFGAVATILVPASLADAATCLPSPAEVHKLQPKAWPKWTRGAQGTRCWFAGKRPVFAKATPGPKPARQRTPNAEREWDFQNGDPIWQPWSMEYRWDDGLTSTKLFAPQE